MYLTLQNGVKYIFNVIPRHRDKYIYMVEFDCKRLVDILFINNNKTLFLTMSKVHLNEESKLNC